MCMCMCLPLLYFAFVCVLFSTSYLHIFPSFYLLLLHSLLLPPLSFTSSLSSYILLPSLSLSPSPPHPFTSLPFPSPPLTSLPFPSPSPSSYISSLHFLFYPSPLTTTLLSKVKSRQDHGHCHRKSNCHQDGYSLHQVNTYTCTLVILHLHIYMYTYACTCIYYDIHE